MMACPQTYIIHHLDVYQGKNVHNVGVRPEIRGLQTTQKAVMNAVLWTRMHLCTDGARIIAMDNRYMCPELGTLLRKKYGILLAGTVRRNRRGWPDSELQKLKTLAERGNSRMMVDKKNKVQCIQWKELASRQFLELSNSTQ